MALSIRPQIYVEWGGWCETFSVWKEEIIGTPTHVKLNAKTPNK